MAHPRQQVRGREAEDIWGLNADLAGQTPIQDRSEPPKSVCQRVPPHYRRGPDHQVGESDEDTFLTRQRRPPLLTFGRHRVQWQRNRTLVALIILHFSTELPSNP